MNLVIGRASACLRPLVAVLAVAISTQADAQEHAGVVTTLEGHVTVTRASLPQPAPLKFKDDIFVRDRIVTDKDSVARILLGGRAVVTVRERSTVTITEAPHVATVDVAAGRVAVAVAREKMRAGDRVEVKTPNAVAGIRGTVIVAEVFGASHSVLTVLKGTIDVTRLEAGRLVGTATTVDALHRVVIAGPAPVSAPERVTGAAARELGQQFRLAPPRATPAAATAAVNAGEVARATKDLNALPRRVAVDRGVRASPVDGEQDEITQNGRGLRGRESWDQPGRAERKDSQPGVKSYGGHPGDAISTAGEGPKSGDGRGRRNRDRY